MMNFSSTLPKKLFILEDIHGVTENLTNLSSLRFADVFLKLYAFIDN